MKVVSNDLEEATAVQLGELRGVIALDGPSGTGKSTVARRLADTLGAGYLDTGAMYRAVTLAVLRSGVATDDEQAVLSIAQHVDLTISTDPNQQEVLLGGENVGAEIRGQAVTLAVSAVSAVAAVRSLLVTRQMRIIAQVCDERGGIVVEGRDIGTVVAPDAGLKVYLTASADARARRRTRQDSETGNARSLDETRQDVDRRDRLDSGRAASLDSTNLDLEGVLKEVLALVDERDLRGVAAGW
jgi:cytidylate kinase